MRNTSTVKPHNSADFPFRIRKRLENLLWCPFISAFWTLLREKHKKSLILYQFLRQDLRSAKSNRNWCISSQLLCALTGMKHHKLLKFMFFHKKSSKKITDIQAKLYYFQKTFKKLENLTKMYVFFCWKKIVFFQKKWQNFRKNIRKNDHFLGSRISWMSGKWLNLGNISWV